MIEWPTGEKQPVKYWLAQLDSAVPGLRRLVRMAHARWRIELDYRELKEELGLDHFEGRHWLGWHHHVTLVTLAYAFLRAEQARLKKNDWCDLTPGPAADSWVLGFEAFSVGDEGGRISNQMRKPWRSFSRPYLRGDTGILFLRGSLEIPDPPSFSTSCQVTGSKNLDVVPLMASNDVSERPDAHRHSIGHAVSLERRGIEGAKQ